jgi:hypothetical protein
MSSTDIPRGTKWNKEISDQLEAARMGIICLTKDNLSSPWVLFEAGALAKTLDNTFVCPYLFELKPTDLEGPLAQFQATIANELDTFELLKTINRAREGKSVSEEQLRILFNRWWPDLEEDLIKINQIVHKSDRSFRPRSTEELLEEILQLIRQQNRDKNLYSFSKNENLQMTFLDVVLGEDLEVNEFAAKIKFDGSDEDPNADPWAAKMDIILNDDLDGQWWGRWSGGNAGNIWKTGTAKIISASHLVCIVYQERISTHIILAEKAKKKDKSLLIGRYFNTAIARDSTPWVGIIVDSNRIDGFWREGRWDFRRNP